MGGIAVIEGTVIGLDRESDPTSPRVVVLVATAQFLGADAPDYEAIVAKLEPGDEIALYYSQGDFDVGESYAFVTGRWGNGEQSVLYAHRPDVDEPTDEFADDVGDGPGRPAEVLDCLADQFNLDGTGRRLDALVMLARHYNATGGRDNNGDRSALDAC
jgi:hypothetical protein